MVQSMVQPSRAGHFEPIPRRTTPIGIRARRYSVFINNARGHSARPNRLLGAASYGCTAGGKCMQSQTRIYSLPRWRVTRWLADCGPDVPDDIRVDLVGNLFGSLPVFAGGVINTVAVAAAIALRQPTALFLFWLGLEIVICTARLNVLLIARRAAAKRARTPTDIYLLLAIAWSASVGYGVIATMISGDWVAATLACLSAAAMVGGICFRNFSAPRLAAVMIVVSLGPTVAGALLAGQPLLYVVLLTAPLYLGAMTAAAFTLNKMLIATVRAERAHSHRAKHDALTGLLNREGLIEAADAGLTLAARERTSLALLFLDLDNFKSVNDTFGHAVGDRLLKSAADRLQGALCAADIAARIGGDEFVVLAQAQTAEQVMAKGERLIAAIACTYPLGEGIAAAVGASIGVAIAPEHGTDAEDLLAVADAALYEAKSGGKSRCCVASASTNLAALRRLQAGVARSASGSRAA
jgi:diguanylate cyclase